MPLRGYQKYERFEDAIDHARIACQNSGNIYIEDCFLEARSDKGKPRNDWKLSSFGSYLVAMHDDLGVSGRLKSSEEPSCIVT